MVYLGQLQGPLETLRVPGRGALEPTNLSLEALMFEKVFGQHSFKVIEERACGEFHLELNCATPLASM